MRIVTAALLLVPGLALGQQRVRWDMEVASRLDHTDRQRGSFPDPRGHIYLLELRARAQGEG